MGLLILAFITGGDSNDRNRGEVLTQLLALPLGVWATFALCASAGSGVRRAAIAVAIAIVAVLALQQLPISGEAWRSIAVRQALADDLSAAGVVSPAYVWSLSPLASERALWSLLPALAMFVGALAMPRHHLRRALVALVVLSAASLLLGCLQLGAPQNSVWNPFPRWPPAMNGMFANPNHQGIAAAMSVVIAVALLLSDRGRDRRRETMGWPRFALGALAVLQFALLPLTGSRAALLLALMGMVTALLWLRGGARFNPASQYGAMAKWHRKSMIALALGGIVFAAGWVRFSMADEVRWSLTKVTATMGWAQAPLGAGTGSFVPWFNQSAPQTLVQWEYFNHAHNEYVQWWFESGLLGMTCLFGVLVILVVCNPRCVVVNDRHGHAGVAVAAWLGCVMLLLHSIVDYPLRTPALMTVAGLLAGVVVGLRHSVARSPGAVVLQR